MKSILVKLKLNLPKLGQEPLLYVAIGFAFLGIGMYANFLGGAFIDDHFTNLVTPHDLILDNVDEYPVFVKIGELAGWLQLILVIATLARKEFRGAGMYLAKAGIFYTFRGMTIILNPLAQIQDPVANGSNPVLAELFYKGMFFSGHTGIAFLLFFLHKENNVMKWVKLGVACLVGVSVLLSHSHYSIDVVGGILAAYAVSRIKIPKAILK